jgi:hypothetical protein
MPRITALLALLALAQTAAAQTGTLYVIRGSGGIFQFGSVNFDPANPSAAKSFTAINTDLGAQYNSLTSDGADGLIGYQTATGALRSISTAGVVSGSASTQTGTNVTGLARSPDGVTYAWNANPIPDRVATVNTTTGVLTNLPNNTGVNSNPFQRGGMAFVGSTLYTLVNFTDILTETSLRTVDTTTGTVSAGFIESTYTNMSLFGVNDKLYGIRSSILYEINLADGSLTSFGAIAGLGVGENFAAYYLVPVPEPGLMLGAAALGLTGFGWLRRRRAASCCT